ncbi:MAG: hypothetical protein P8179_00655 [Candidatus Thiodiazotropha sp.]
MKGALVVVQGKGRSRTSTCQQHLYILAQCAIVSYFKELQYRHVPTQACHSHGSMIYPIGNHDQ